MTLKGIVKDNVIELLDNVELPEGTEVEVLIVREPSSADGFRRGSPQAVLAAMAGSKVTAEDVDELMRLIKESRSPADSRGVFDEEESGR
jgi:hypothetical protein